MAVRVERRARLRRAASGRVGFVALALALPLAGGLVATWPHATDGFRSHFVAGGAPGYGEAAPGDHLQTGYHLWLAGHQLSNGHAPWLDPYSFRPEAEPTPNLQGWPFGLPYWPLVALFGAVAAWNLFVLLTYVGAGGLACAWLRSLDLPRGAALAGGLAFAIAPYRVQQSVGHLLGPISMLVPLALLGLERGRRGGWGWLVLAAAALASIPLSGQVHLALGAIPFVCAYGLVRSRERRMLVAVAAALVVSLAAGALVQRTVISHSVLSGGRSLHAVAHYSASLGDFVSREKGSESERFVFLGWATPVLAAVGLVVAWRTRRRLAWLLGAGTVVPILLAFGTRLPLYTVAWHAFPPLRFPRVPERLMPIACLCIAALVALAVGRVSRGRALLAPVLAIALLFVDLHVGVYGASAADEGNAAYAAVKARPEGRVLELPVFLPEIHYGSVYHYYGQQTPRERPLGYSSLAPRQTDALARRLRALNCGRMRDPRLLDELGVRYVLVHGGLYARNPFTPPRCRRPAEEGLRRLGFRQIAGGGVVTAWAAG